MELEGRQELVDMGKSSGTWIVPTLSLRLAVLNVFLGFFGPKMAAFGPKLQLFKLRSAICEFRSRPPPLSFLLKLCVIVLHTHTYHAPKFYPNLKHHDGGLVFPHFARGACLLLACYSKQPVPSGSIAATLHGSVYFRCTWTFSFFLVLSLYADGMRKSKCSIT